jgi:hypothetical protein
MNHVRSGTAAVALAILAVAQPTRGQDKTAKMPSNPWAGARVGDWAAYTDENKEGDEPAKLGWRTVVVRKLDGTTVTFTEDENGSVSESKADQKEELTTEKCLKVKAEGTWVDEKHKVGDHEFACKKLSFTETHEGTKILGDVWIAEEVRAGMVVATLVRIVDPSDDKKVLFTGKLEIAGFGSKDAKDWGKTCDEVSAARPEDKKAPETKPDDKKPDDKAEEKKPDVKLPFNVWAKARVGDWAVYSVETRDRDEPVKKEWMAYVVEKVGRKTVTVVRTNHGKKEQHVESSAAVVTVKKYIDIHSTGDWTDEKHKVGGREFSCKKIALLEGSSKVKWTGEIRLSDEVHAGALVQSTVKMTDGEEKQVFSLVKFQIVGFGSRDKTEWGKTLEEVSKAGK